MGDPRHVRPDEVEIVVARELRKAGLELSRPRVVARHDPSGDDPGEFAAELRADASIDGSIRPVLIEFRNHAAPVSVDAVRAFAARQTAPPHADGPKRLMSTPAPEADRVEPSIHVMFSTSGYEPGAVREAQTLGVALLAIADGPAAFRRSQWAMGDQPPAWVPEYMAELVDLGIDGAERRRLVSSGVKLTLPSNPAPPAGRIG